MRKLSAMAFIVLMALLLVACGNGGDEEAEPIAETEDAVSTIAPTEGVSNEATPSAGTPPSATPVAGGSPTSAVVPEDAATGATPELGESPASVASPVGIATPAPTASPGVVAPVGAATPATIASPVAATPAAADMAPPPVSDDMATPDDEAAAATFTLNGRVELAGNLNEAFVLTGEGCVGLGRNADMREGRQVVVRSETGMIIGVTTLDAVYAGDNCAWSFTLDVPESTFYAVSIPLKTELVFTHDDIEQNDGEITIILP